MAISIRQYEPLGLQIFKELHRAIITLELTPGQSISVQEIATQIGVSRQPVREAFIKLAEAGLVTVIPKRGTYVRKISIQEVLGARFNREAIETAVAREAMEKLDQRDLDELQALINKQSEAALADDRLKFIQYDDEFHKTICVLTGRLMAWEVVEADKAQMDRVRYLSPEFSNIQEYINQHKVILQAIRNRDSKALEKAVKEHLSGIIQILPIMAQRYQEYFEEDGG
jgi:DNA-binding GntR family transcriptional regulator